MSGTWGNRLTLTLFGESHGPGIGMVIGGFPPGIQVDEARIATEMARRAPGQSWMSTPRKETDKVRILSGVYQGYTTGAPICGVIENNDPRGGGHFSGRLTAPLVFAGALAREYLSGRGVEVAARIVRLGGVADGPLDEINEKRLKELRQSAFPVCSAACGQDMREEIRKAMADEDSVGGVIECIVLGVPAGWGEPHFGSLESRISSLLFAVPAVKGVEFGSGFAIADLRGSEANDAFFYQNNQVETETNHNGGILGGISSGMPLMVRAAVKPTPSIGRTQATVDLEKGCMAELNISGRHDPCIVPRAVCVVEAAVLLALCEAALEEI